MAGFNNDVVYATGLDFSGSSPVANKMLLDGQILIGSTALNAGGTHINVNTLTAGSGISITNGPGTITITNTGGGGPVTGTQSLMGNSGSATQVGGVISVVGSTGITTTGSGSTLTITPTGNLLSLQNLAGTGYVVQTGASTFVNRSLVAGTGITLTNADGVAGATTITAATSVPTTFTEDAGSATPSSNNINILGTSAQGISTSGAGSTVTITAANASAVQKGVASFNATNFTVSSGAVSSNAITVTAGTGLTTGGSVNLGGSVTLSLDIPVTVPHGGTGQTTLTNHGVVLGQGASAVAVTAAGTNGQVLIGATGADPAFATIAGTQGVTLTPGANTLSIGLVNVPNSALQNSSITVNAGSGISVVGSPVSLGGAVTISASGTTLTQLSADSGVATPSGNNINVLGTASQGISTSASGATLTITAANATTTTRGVASFNSSDFTVSAGAVSLVGTGAIKTLTPDEDFDGSAATPISPQSNNVNVLGSNPSFATVTESYNTSGTSTGNLKIEHRAWLTGLVVDSSTTPGTRSTYSTIASALTAATSGQTIFIRTGTYTENLTLKAGVNLTAFTCDAFTPNVTIVGKLTFTAAGTVSISGINLQTNSDNVLAVTGSAASIINLNNCNLNLTNNTGITFSSSSSSAEINISNCTCDTGTTGIAYFSDSSAGTMTVSNSNFENSGASSTANTKSAGSISAFFANFRLPFNISTSTTNNTFQYCLLTSAATNTTALTTSGTGTTNIVSCNINSGTASAISIGSGTTVAVSETKIACSNANAITGAGTLAYTPISFTSTGVDVNTTTQNTKAYGPRILLSGGCELLSGSGSPSGSVTAPKGSLWLRTDGSTTTNRAFINTNGGTTWTAITTSA